MTDSRVPRSLILCLALAGPVQALSAQAPATLPNAPQPALPSSPRHNHPPAPVLLPGHPAPGEEGPADRASREKRKWALSIDPGEQVPPLTTANKLEFWLHEEAHPSARIPEFLGAFYGQPLNQPAYGTDAGAFGERLGAAFIRDASMRFFVSSVFPVLAHEDPRYFRKARGSWQSRTRWATVQAIVVRHDSGRRSLNVSNILGHLAASILTLAYYPDPSANARMVFRTWGTSIAGTAGNNLLLEFWPDVVHKVIHRRHWLRRKVGLKASSFVSDTGKQSR